MPKNNSSISAKFIDYSVNQVSSQKMSVSQTENSFLPDQNGDMKCEVTALWRAVITQALMDAGSQSKKTEFKKARAHAISWLNGDSEDFNEVCSMADFSPDHIKHKAREAIKRGCAWKKEPKQRKT